MEGQIDGEDGEYLKIYVTDTNETTHDITIEIETGEIVYHDQDGYPDKAARRTDEGNERVAQARRFAKYHVYVKKGYDTVPAPENPVRIDAVREAIARMDVDEFESLFGDLYQQFAYDERGEGQPAIDLPPQATDPPIYAQNVYLGIDPLETDLGETLAKEHGLDTTQSAADLTPDDITASEIQDWAEFAGEFVGQAATDQIDISESLYIDETSQLYVKYPSGGELVADDDHLRPAAREPDTIIELLPIDPQDMEYFQSFMDHYLRCQIRDCFVEMGLTPPEPYQVLGLGRFMAARGYDYIDFYPPYHKPNSEQLQNSTLF